MHVLVQYRKCNLFPKFSKNLTKTPADLQPRICIMQFYATSATGTRDARTSNLFGCEGATWKAGIPADSERLENALVWHKPPPGARNATAMLIVAGRPSPAARLPVDRTLTNKLTNERTNQQTNQNEHDQQTRRIAAIGVFRGSCACPPLGVKKWC